MKPISLLRSGASRRSSNESHGAVEGHRARVGASSRPITCSSVLLPQPEGPIRRRTRRRDLQFTLARPRSDFSARYTFSMSDSRSLGVSFHHRRPTSARVVGAHVRDHGPSPLPAGRSPPRIVVAAQPEPHRRAHGAAPCTHEHVLHPSPLATAALDAQRAFLRPHHHTSTRRLGPQGGARLLASATRRRGCRSRCGAHGRHRAGQGCPRRRAADRSRAPAAARARRTPRPPRGRSAGRPARDHVALAHRAPPRSPPVITPCGRPGGGEPQLPGPFALAGLSCAASRAPPPAGRAWSPGRRSPPRRRSSTAAAPRPAPSAGEPPGRAGPGRTTRGGAELRARRFELQFFTSHSPDDGSLPWTRAARAPVVRFRARSGPAWPGRPSRARSSSTIGSRGHRVSARLRIATRARPRLEMTAPPRASRCPARDHGLDRPGPRARCGCGRG